MESVQIAAVCGLCYGCQQALKKTLETVAKGSTCLYKEIVHNQHVNQSLRARGVTIVTDLSAVPAGATVVLCAHGEPPATYQYLQAHQIPFVDATCPSVARVHQLVQTAAAAGRTVVLVGNYGKVSGKMHTEVAGTIGYAPQVICVQDLDDVTAKLAALTDCAITVVAQTTFSAALFDAIVARLQTLAVTNCWDLSVHRTLCAATTQIQNCARELCAQCDLLLVVGSAHSHNSQELFQVVRALKPAVFVEDVTTWPVALVNSGLTLTPETRVGITAGASTDRATLVVLQQQITKQLAAKMLVTPRLILRQWQDTDAATLYQLAKNPAVGLIAGWPPHTSVDASFRVIQEEYLGATYYAVCDQKTNQVLGGIALKFAGQTDMTTRADECELSYWLGQPYWGQGLMPEAARAVIRHAFTDLSMQTIWCGYYDGNQQSRRVQEKLGFVYHHTCDNVPVTRLNEVRVGHTQYLTRERWAKFGANERI